MLTGAFALAAGYGFMVDPSGKGVGISTDYLNETAPFKDYLIPGIILFVVNGVLSCLIAVWTILKYHYHPVFISLQGCIYVGWIAVQLTMVKIFHPLHAIIAE
jgi:hypothetical protein